MSDPKDDEAKFNETLKRMLNTPPQKRAKGDTATKKGQRKTKPKRESSSD